jgi:hypothetical protein
MTKKMTKKDMFTAMLNKYAFTDDEKAFIEHEIELLTKKSSGERKPTATQVANEALKEAIMNFLTTEPDRIFAVGELIKEVPELAGLSTQKVTPMLSALEKAQQVVKVVEKRKSYYKLA